MSVLWFSQKRIWGDLGPFSSFPFLFLKPSLFFFVFLFLFLFLFLFFSFYSFPFFPLPSVIFFLCLFVLCTLIGVGDGAPRTGCVFEYSNKAWGTGARIASLVGYISSGISLRYLDSLLLVAMIHCPNLVYDKAAWI